MAKQNLVIPRYIKLVTDAKLSDDDIKQWYRTVKENGPNGVIYGVPVVKRGKPSTVTMVHRVVDGKRHEYLIPLLRDLTESESEAIVHAWDAYYPAGDMDIEISAVQAAKLDQQAPAVRVPNDQYLGLCIALAKTQHADWMRDRSDAGWRYGPTLSLRRKTHPLLRTWDQLPAKYRKIDQDTPERVLGLLNDQGYAVIKREELDSLLKLLRGAM